MSRNLPCIPARVLSIEKYVGGDLYETVAEFEEEKRAFAETQGRIAMVLFSYLNEIGDTGYAFMYAQDYDENSDGRVLAGHFRFYTPDMRSTLSLMENYITPFMWNSGALSRPWFNRLEMIRAIRPTDFIIHVPEHPPW